MAAAAPRPAEGFAMLGYRNFLREPGPEQRAATHGTDRLWRLALVLHAGDPQGASEDNPCIPAGHTYLLQLAAHDCVHTPTPFWQIPPGRKAVRNARVGRLRLDTLYGLGPPCSPHAYEPDDARDLARSRLRLGPGTGGKPGRDIARLPGPPPSRPDALSEPLICDPRNEDHAILAQVTALWHLVHNALLGLVPPEPGGGEAAQERSFAWARAATTLCYRCVLRDEVLVGFLHPEVLSRYAGIAEGGLLDRDAAHPRPRVSIPLEVSHGAMRAAHAMVRPSYQFTDERAHTIGEARRHTSARTARAMPLGAGWLIRWSLFFDGIGGGRARNRSLLLRPRYLNALLDRTEFAGPAPGWGLALQDMASAEAAPAWSVSALYAAIEERGGQRGWDDPFAGGTLHRPAVRERALADWLDGHGDGMLQPGDIAPIIADPPLPFYLLLEAEHDHGGRRLGPLGSILLAETFFGAMLGDPLPGERPGPARPLREALADLAGALGVQAPDDRLPGHATMAALVAFVAREHGLDDATPAFL